MRPSTLAIAACACAALAPGSVRAVQTVTFANVTLNAAAATVPVFVANGDTVKFDASLTANGTANPPGTGGLGLCLVYKRSAVNDPVITNLLSTNIVADGAPDPLAGCVAGSAAATAGADTMVIKAWAVDTGGNWPNVALPVKLYDAQFRLTAPLSGSTRIGFGASSVAPGQTFTSNGPLLLCGKPTVTVTKTADGSEVGPVAVTFSVSLSAAVPAECGTAGAFAVALTLGGTATVPGQTRADYTISGNAISGSGALVTATFPADSTTSALTVIATPVVDNATEGTEQVTLTVASGSSHYGGVANTASASITESATAVGTVVEYLDTIDFPTSPGGHFFYSSDPLEQAAVDAGAAGNFFRTGRQFQIGGTSPVCRFYGSQTPGPNSHFFTVNVDECNALKAAQVTPTPTTTQQWNYEGIGYSTTPPVGNANGVLSCPANTVPLYRAYNNAFPLTGPKNAWDSNHRFTPVLADIAEMVGKGWRDEGLTFCTSK